MLEAMNARAVQQLEARLDELRRVGNARLATAAAAALLAAPAHVLDPPLSFGLGAGAFVLAVLSVRALAERGELIDTAVADPDAIVIRAVRARAERIGSAEERARAAQTLRRLALSEYAHPRVASATDELLELANALSYSELEPTVAVQCVRFVEGVDSPLYDPAADALDVRARIRHLLLLVHAGMPQNRSAGPPITVGRGGGTLHST
jgi:hypothetical protein